MRLAVRLAGSLLILLGCSKPGVAPKPWTLRELEVHVADTSREVSFTNKQAGFFVTESNAPSSDPWHGWHIMSTRILADYTVQVDGTSLDRSRISGADVRPDLLRRTYDDGPVETIALLDSIDALVVTLELRTAAALTVTPHLPNASAPEVVTQGPGNILLIARRPSSELPDGQRVPVWLGVGSTATDAKPDTALRQLLVHGREGANHIFFVAGHTPEEVTATISDLRQSVPQRLRQRRERMEALLNASLFRSSHHRFDLALAWAKLSLDALIMRQGKTGIFAGLPWFSNYWGRDTFISLAGATLVTGQLEAAREILRSFASWQNADPSSPDEGRIPNLVTPTSTSYNTADGTPWFVIGVYDYVRASGDTAFVREMFPVLRRAIEGPLRHRVDRERFLTHGDAETWMDAVGPDGPWSPRGDRANDIQALWYKQLVISTAFAELAGERGLAERWSTIADELHVRFQDRFVDEVNGRIVDHLNRDGTADSSLRPNQLFALDLVRDPSLRARVLKNVTSTLVYPHGVGSLAPEDPNFHPYHHAPAFYPKDAAYHNGIVWTWLAGPWVKAMVEFGRPNLAFRITEDLAHQVLERGAVGTISELLDAAPRGRETEPRLSGTFSQAWSLAEFVRTTYHSYLGVSVDAPNRQLWLLPQLPLALSTATFDVSVGTSRIRVTYEGDAGAGTITVRSLEQDLPIRVLMGWPLAGRRGRSAGFSLQPRQRVSVTLTEAGAAAEAEQPSEISIDTQIQTLVVFPELADLELATPRVPPGVRSLQAPGHPLLSIDDVSRVPLRPAIIVEADDPAFDDRGPGRFLYPTTPSLTAGSLDLTRFHVAADDSIVRMTLTFRALSDPGWHPEYGFQLTIAAIAIDVDGRPGSGQARIGRNARATMPSGLGYERIVYVGGGLRIEDAAGTVLAEYRPAEEDARRPIGRVSEGTVSFSLPRSVLGAVGPSTRWVVYVGAQDDHGGAGLGDFRSVEGSAGEWHGGGRTSSVDPNVYDQLTITSR